MPKTILIGSDGVSPKRPGYGFWRLLKGGLQFTLGVALVFGSLWAMARWRQAHRNLPVGWSIFVPPEEVSALLEVGEVVWSGGKDGLHCFLRRSGERLPLPQGTPRFAFVRALALDAGGAIWVAHAKGLSRFVAGRWEPSPVPPGLSPGLALLQARDGRFWAGGEGGLFVSENGIWRPVAFREECGAMPVDVLSEDHSGRIWVGSAPAQGGGLWVQEGDRWVSAVSEGSLPHPAVNAILQTREGSLWVGCGFADRGGAARLEQGRWTTLRKEDGLAGHKVRSLHQDRRGRLLFGAEYDGLAILEAGQFRIIGPRSGLAGKEVKVFLEDAEGVFWLGTDTGLSRIEKL